LESDNKWYFEIDLFAGVHNTVCDDPAVDNTAKDVHKYSFDLEIIAKNCRQTQKSMD
jgi:hypothetical protein